MRSLALNARQVAAEPRVAQQRLTDLSGCGFTALFGTIALHAVPLVQDFPFSVSAAPLLLGNSQEAAEESL
jgi:hypothetical protein